MTWLERLAKAPCGCLREPGGGPCARSGEDIRGLELYCLSRLEAAAEAAAPAGPGGLAEAELAVAAMTDAEFLRAVAKGWELWSQVRGALDADGARAWASRLLAIAARAPVSPPEGPAPRPCTGAEFVEAMQKVIKPRTDAEIYEAIAGIEAAPEPEDEVVLSTSTSTYGRPSAETPMGQAPRHSVNAEGDCKPSCNGCRWRRDRGLPPDWEAPSSSQPSMSPASENPTPEMPAACGSCGVAGVVGHTLRRVGMQTLCPSCVGNGAHLRPAETPVGPRFPAEFAQRAGELVGEAPEMCSACQHTPDGEDGLCACCRRKRGEAPVGAPRSYHETGPCVCPIPRVMCPACDHDCARCKYVKAALLSGREMNDIVRGETPVGVTCGTCGGTGMKDVRHGDQLCPACRGCGKPLDPNANERIADGCPCNSPRGVNHGLVPPRVCTCKECDPAETGSARPVFYPTHSATASMSPGPENPTPASPPPAEATHVRDVMLKAVETARKADPNCPLCHGRGFEYPGEPCPCVGRGGTTPTKGQP